MSAVSPNFAAGRLAGPLDTAAQNVCAAPLWWLLIALALGYAIGIVTAPGGRLFSR